MIWTDTPCRITCWNHGNKTEVAMRSPNIECIVAQHPWLENDCLYADIILPSNTFMEVDDILTNIRQGTMQPNIMMADKAIEPIGESKSDFEVVVEVAKKLGYEEVMTENKTIFDMQKKIWEYMGGDKLVTWEQLKEETVLDLQHGGGLGRRCAGFPQLLQRSGKIPLSTPTGKLEFYSQVLADKYPDDKERPPIPKWVEKSHNHDERIPAIAPNVPAADDVQPRPLARARPMRRYHLDPRSAHLQGNGTGRLQLYEPCWMHLPKRKNAASKTAISSKIFNERGIVLCGAYVTERVRPGVCYMDHGARHDPIKNGEHRARRRHQYHRPPEAITSENCVGQATSGYLVTVERPFGQRDGSVEKRLSRSI